MTRVMGTLHEDLSTFMIVCCLILVRMRNVLDESCRDNQNTHFIFSNFFFFPPENHAVCEVMWTNVVEPEMPQMTI